MWTYLVVGLAVVVVLLIVALVVGLRWAKRAEQEEVDAIVGHDCPLCGSDRTQDGEQGSWRCTRCGFESSWEARPDLAGRIRTVQDLNRAYACYERAADRLLAVTGALGGAPAGAVGNQEAMEEARREMDDGFGLLAGLARTYPELFTAAPDAAVPADGAVLLDLAVGGRIGASLDHGEIQRTLGDLATFSGKLKEAIRRSREGVLQAARG